MTFRSLFPISEQIKYLGWRLKGRATPIDLKMRSGGHIALRAQQGLARDYGTAYDIFIHELYRVEIEEPRIIVDLGANVGYTMLYFSLRYPKAKIYAFEPHPEHFRCLANLIAINGLQDRVFPFNAAVGAKSGNANLSDGGTCSKLMLSVDGKGVPVEVMDFYEWAESIGQIDLLKIDIEGGEFAILSDPRFAELPCRDIVMESHSDDEHGDGSKWCMNTLEHSGFLPRVTLPDSGEGVSMIYAHRDAIPAVQSNGTRRHA